MKSRKHSKLKRNPFVRFIRGIFRLMRVLLKPKQRKHIDRQTIQNERQAQLAAELARQQELARQLELEDRERERLITVGALFDRVKWQVPEVTTLQEQVPDLSAVGRPYDVSRN